MMARWRSVPSGAHPATHAPVPVSTEWTRPVCVVRRTHDRDEPPSRAASGYFYGCANNWKRGPAICRNTVRIPQEALDRAVPAASGAGIAGQLTRR